jgi:hypothetical protein
MPPIAHALTRLGCLARADQISLPVTIDHAWAKRVSYWNGELLYVNAAFAEPVRPCHHREEKVSIAKFAHSRVAPQFAALAVAPRCGRAAKAWEAGEHILSAEKLQYIMALR